MRKIMLIAAVAALTLGGAAIAQDAPAPGPAASLGVSQMELQKMYVLDAKVREISAQAQASIDAAADTQARAVAQRAMYEQLSAAVAAEGLTVERYNQIANMAANNQALADEIRDVGEAATATE
jgi:hypothetical protein